VGSGEQIEACAVEENGDAEVFAVAVAEGIVLDRLDCVVQPFADGVGDAMLEALEVCGKYNEQNDVRLSV
jgi:hypothetical protein